jgi:phosphoglycolate phosphatase
MDALSQPVVVFDLDGTLVDSAPAIADSVNWLMSRYDRSAFSVAQVRSFMGCGIEVVVRDALTHACLTDHVGFDEAFPKFMAHHTKYAASSIHPWQGADRALTSLHQDGVQLALCTNKLEILTRPLLQALNWGKIFDRIICGDTLRVRKPDPRPLIAAVGEGQKSAVFVGDTAIDLATARAANVPCILMDPAGVMDEMETSGAPVLTSFSDLSDEIHKILR